MHLRGNVIYNTWENFWKKAYKSSYFRAQYDETSERTDWSLSERQLFTQSNGRTLLGQDTMGRLHFLCTPHDKIYAVLLCKTKYICRVEELGFRGETIERNVNFSEKIAGGGLVIYIFAKNADGKDVSDSVCLWEAES